MNHLPRSSSPTVTAMRVIPVAGRDSMLLNLCGAHGPFFIRNLVLLESSDGRLGIGEVPGGDGILQALQKAVPLVEGSELARYQRTLNAIRASHGAHKVAQGARDDAVAMRCLFPGWTYDPKRPSYAR